MSNYFWMWFNITSGITLGALLSFIVAKFILFLVRFVVKSYTGLSLEASMD